MLTNPRVKQCGCYDISWKEFLLETSMSKNEIQELLEKFENEYELIKYNKKTKEILLLNFYKYNWTSSPKVKACIEKELLEIKDKSFVEYLKKMIGYKYSMDRVSIPLGEKEKEKEKEKGVLIYTLENIVTTPPTDTDTVFNFCLSNFNNYNQDDLEKSCRKFFNYYQERGWKNVKNWQEKLNMWIEDDIESKKIKRSKKRVEVINGITYEDGIRIL